MMTTVISIDGDAVLAQRLIRSRLCGNNHAPSIHGYKKERSQLYELILRTLKFGESNSLLIIGPRGSGKTMLLNDVLRDLRKITEFKDTMEVQLNGLLQTDDRISLKEMTRQLKLENVVGDRVFGSFAENLQFLLDALKGGDKQSKSVLFILDEFDLFAQHKNQTLLYNLFDVAQSAQAPICVIGLTARMDVTELLEKRVKSRFSHRQIQLFPLFSFEEYQSVFVSHLTLPKEFAGSDIYAKEWNKRVQGLATEPAVLEVLRRQYHLDQNIRALQTFLLLPICRISVENPFLEASEFVSSFKLVHATDSKAAMLHGISVLELCLIIAMKHLTDVYAGQPFNFEMVFSEYQKFCQRKSAIQLFEKPVVLKAFEHLCALELVRPAEGSTSRIQKEYQLMNLMVESSEISEALLKYPNCPTEVKQWASCSF